MELDYSQAAQGTLEGARRLVLCGYVGEDVCITDLCICNSLCTSHKELILLLLKQGWFLSFDKYYGYIRWQYEEKLRENVQKFFTLLV